MKNTNNIILLLLIFNYLQAFDVNIESNVFSLNGDSTYRSSIDMSFESELKIFAISIIYF